MVVADGRERDGLVLAEDPVVVDSEYGDLVRHGYAGGPAGVQHHGRVVVGVAEHRQRLSGGLQPVCERRRPGGGEPRHLRPKPPLEACVPEMLDVPPLAREEGDLPEAALPEVVGGEASDRLVVSADPRQADLGAGQREVHDGDAAPAVARHRVHERTVPALEHHERAVADPVVRGRPALPDRKVPRMVLREARNAAKALRRHRAYEKQHVTPHGLSRKSRFHVRDCIRRYMNLQLRRGKMQKLFRRENACA